MDKIRELLRMKELKFSERAIAVALKISRPTVADYAHDCSKAGVTHEVATRLSDKELLEKIGRPAPAPERLAKLRARFRGYVSELKRTGVTLRLLWETYNANEPDGYRYSQFCHQFREWSKGSEVSMRMEHKAGAKMFTDFTGQKMSVTDRETGAIREVEIFVAILGASQLTYAEALESQKKHDWIRANENALRYFGGVTGAIVPDCLKSAVTKADRYDPDINPDYYDFAQHYGTVILPARPRKPKDKSLVEGAVRLVYQRVFAPLRDRVFFSLAELNEAILDQLDKHNSRPMQLTGQSRRQLFEECERSALRPLPVRRYEFRYFQKARVQYNYHVYLREDGHFYSVPYRYKGRETRVIYTDRAVEVFCDNVRIAAHERNRRKGGYTTVAEHMPSHHRAYAERGPERLMEQARLKGKHVAEVVRLILAERQHPEQAFRACSGLLHLDKKYGVPRLNRACRRAVHFGCASYRAVRNILEKGLDRLEDDPQKDRVLPNHDNVRGQAYYAAGGAE